MSQHAEAQAKLAIIGEIHVDGLPILGPNWTLVEKMKTLADNGNVDGMVRYFKNCETSDVGKRTRRRLEAAGKKTLESVKSRFMAAH